MKIPKGSIKALRQRRSRAEGSEIPYKVGDLIAGRYEVRDTLGKGPFGVVFKTFDQELESEVAVKVCGGHWLEGEEGQSRFEQAVRQARRLSQQNIVRLYDSGFEQERAFVAMQFLEGLNLRGVLKLREDKGEPFTLLEIEPLLQQMASALGYCHRSGYHGDLKPENIILLPERLKITDFFIHEGVGADALSGQSRLSVYMSPEVREDPNAADPRSDIYSVAVIVAELLGGQAFKSEVVLPRVNNPDLPVGVDKIIARATHADPAERHETLEDFAVELLSSDQVTEAVESLQSLSEVEAVEISESTESGAIDTAIYKLDVSSQDGQLDPLDIPTPLDIGEGPTEHTSEAIILDDLDELEIVEEEEVATTAMAPLERPPTPPSPDVPAPAPVALIVPDQVMGDELETIEQPREEIPEPEAAPEPTPPKAKKKSFMKPVEPKEDTPAKVIKPPEGNRSTERVKTLPKTKARGESVASKGRDRLTLAIFLLSVFILVGVGVFFFYSQFMLSKRTSEVVKDFGNEAVKEAPEKPGKQ